ncbi:hypothetical protein Nepgr_014425 [Nepenthes gracilis]|uniref:Uncharacterized protein n=1 Tax=Nepenthes gracilis TaxID=150966 RepID=A0AAD3XQ44_NEPGR|nr:hypothetical protein Nepgr_014425 [Nepenthes gracilis]
MTRLSVTLNFNSGNLCRLRNLKLSVVHEDNGMVSKSENPSSISTDWFHENQWEISGSEVPDAEDSYDAFNDLRSSTGTEYYQWKSISAVVSDSKTKRENDSSADAWDDF